MFDWGWSWNQQDSRFPGLEDKNIHFPTSISYLSDCLFLWLLLANVIARTRDAAGFGTAAEPAGFLGWVLLLFRENCIRQCIGTPVFSSPTLLSYSLSIPKEYQMQRNKPAFILGSQKPFHPGMNVCACDRERYILDVSEPFPSRFQLSSSNLLLTEHSGWEKDLRRAPTIISYILKGQYSLSWECLPSSCTHRYTHLQSRATQNPSCCQKIPALPKSIVGNFCYCLSLAISRFLSVFLPVYLSLLVFLWV